MGVIRSQNAKRSLEKAIDSAILAVETYNKPAVKFKTGGFVVLMIIAWTALFHAYFFRKQKKPFHKKKGENEFETRNDDFFYWELAVCLQKYYKDDTQNPVRLNLEFFIDLRNRIEHKSLPELDADLFAESQQMLLNFDRMIEQEFGREYCLRESLSFALQLYADPGNLAEAIKANADAQTVKNFIDSYRNTISTEVMDSGQYAFKAFLMQVGNHETSDSLPIQFFRYDNMSDEEKRTVKRIAGFTKFRDRAISGKDLMYPTKVIEKVQQGLGNPQVLRNKTSKNKFNSDTHTRCWKKYGVRPPNGDANPANTNSEYCSYDEPSQTYRYTENWVRFLIKKMTDDDEYNSLYQK